ncbi:MAG TPA: large conductance mechanosensitive channel protein MscL [Actinocrinis sp.]
MFKGFRDFIMRGNVVELAVAVVMGTAFSAIVSALVNDLITPLITAAFGKTDYSALFITVNHSKIMYGSFLNAVISFLLIAIGVYFFIVAPMNHVEKVRRRMRGLPPTAPATLTEIELLTQIRDALRAQQQGPGSQGPDSF